MVSGNLKLLKSEEVHPSHSVIDTGWFVSDPQCTKCGIGVYDKDYRHQTVPCEGFQGELYEKAS